MSFQLLQTQSQAEEILLALIKRSSKNSTITVDATCRPLLDLEDFDSLSALEVLTELEELTDIHVTDEVFLAPDGRRALSIREIAAEVIKASNRVEAPSGKR